MNADQINHLTYDHAVTLAAMKIREAVMLGPDKTSASSTELIMIAFATCDRQRWLPDANASSTGLWARLDERQREAITQYLSGTERKSGNQAEPLPCPVAGVAGVMASAGI